jgi:hypothetical protein
VVFDVTDQLQIRLFAFVRYWGKKLECIETVHQIFTNFKKDHVSVRSCTIFS